jgi:hypothetical protein
MSTTISRITCAGLTNTGTLVQTGAVSFGAVTAATSLAVGGGTAITKILKGTVSVTVAAGLAAAEEDISVTIAGLGVTDVIVLTPLNAGMETGVAIVGAWCSVAGTMKIRISNVHTSTLTGSTSLWNYCVIQS